MPHLTDASHVLLALTEGKIGRLDDFEEYARSLPDRYFVDPDSGRKAALSHQIANIATQETIYRITCETGIWPSSELPYLAHVFRNSHGIHSEQFIGCEELGEVDVLYNEGMIFCSFSFCWSFAVIWLPARAFLYFDHDEWLSFKSHDPEIQIELSELVEKFELPLIRY